MIAGMYMEDEAGNIDLDEKYTLKNSDKVTGAGSLYGKPAGYQTTYRNLVQLMGKQSDNTAFKVLSKQIEEEDINRTLDYFSFNLIPYNNWSKPAEEINTQIM